MASILVVDDEPDVLEALARALRIAGHDVSKAATANDALTLSADHSFDVVVLDYIMPSMSGVALLNKIRTYQPSVRAIIVSGKIDAQVSEESLALELRESIEADVYLHKPVENPRLVQAIADLLDIDKAPSWNEIAERSLGEERPQADIRKVERSLNKFKRRKKR